MIVRALILVLALAACDGSPSSTGTTETDTLVVRVAFSDGEPAAGLPVVVDPGDRSATTDAGGTATFADVPEGIVTIRVRPPGETETVSVWDLEAPFDPVDVTLALPEVRNLAIDAPGGAVAWGAPERLEATADAGLPPRRLVWVSTGDRYRGEPVEIGRGASVTTAALRPGSSEVELRYVYAGRILERATTEVEVSYRERWNVRLRGRLALPPGTAADVTVEGDRAYLARGPDGGFSIVELDGVREIGRYTAPGMRSNAVEARGDLAFVANESRDYAFGVAFFDVTDPTDLRPFNGVPDCCVHDLRVEGTTLYVVQGARGTIQAIDITNPRNLGGRRNLVGGHHLHVAGGVLLAVGGGEGPDPAGMRVLDVIDPFDPTPLGTFDLPGTTPVSVSRSPGGRYAYVVEDALNAPVRIVDVSNPALPVLAGTYQPRLGARSRRMTVREDGLAALTTGEHGVEILDVSNPVDPRLVGFYDTAPGSGGMGSFVPADDPANGSGAWAVGGQAGGPWAVADVDAGLLVLESDS